MEDKVMKKLYILTILAAFSFACVPLDTDPWGSETDTIFWKEDPNAAYSALNSCYTSLNDIYEVVFSDGMTDNAYVKGGNNQSIGNGRYGTSEGYVYSVWNNHYSGIRKCNEVLAHIDEVPGLKAELKARYIAEAMAIRSFHYYELYCHFGGVPYFDHPISVAEARSATRMSADALRDQIVTDLKSVINSDALPASYTGADRGRITKWTARAILAKVYLWDNNYSALIPLTEEIMGSGINLYGNYAQLFELEHEYEPEIMLARQYTPHLLDQDVIYSIMPPTLHGYTAIAPLKSLMDSYIMLNGKAIGEAGSGYSSADPWKDRDPRMAATVMYPGNSYPTASGNVEPDWADRDAFGSTSDVTPTGYYIRKWWDKSCYDNTHSGLNGILIRYADILLMNAEAHVEQGSMDATVWNNTIRKIRARAGFTQAGALDFPSGASKEQLREIVRNERRVELAFEGQRRNDIFRWRTAETVLNGECLGYYSGSPVGTRDGFVIVENRVFNPSRHYLWPIPQKERDLTQNALDQNPNW